MRTYLLVVMSCAAMLVIGCENKSQPPAPDPAERKTEPVKPFDPSSATKPVQAVTAPTTKAADAPKAPAPGGTPVIVIETSMGNIEVELTPEQTPVTVANFLRYVDEKFYDGTVFHRVAITPQLKVIQGGGFTTGLEEKRPHEPIANESDNAIGNGRGTIAMARRGDPASATCQFYINVGDNSFLDHLKGGYAAFGRVVAGMDVADQISKVQTSTQQATAWDGAQFVTVPFENVPVQTVEIRSVRRK